MITVAPRRRNHAANGTQALRVGSITTWTSWSAGSRDQSSSRSSGVVRNRWRDHSMVPVWSAQAAWWELRQAMSIPSLMMVIEFSFVV